MASVSCSRGTSAAKYFVQIARRDYSTAIHSHVPLAFLAPRTTTVRCVFRPRANLSLSRQAADLSRGQSRTFSASTTRRATTCVLNPQQDEDGKEMMLEITPRAAKVSFQPSQLATKTELFAAPVGNHEERRQPKPSASHTGRKRRLPRLSISHEPSHDTAQGCTGMVVSGA